MIDPVWLKSELAAASFAMREARRAGDQAGTDAAKYRVRQLRNLRPRPAPRPHARDVSDREFLSEVVRISVAPFGDSGDLYRWLPRWVFIGELCSSFEPWQSRPVNERCKLVRSKADRLITRGLLDGCTCGCRGDFELTEAGRRLLDS